MSAATLLKGLVIGFSIAAPVGPVGVLCIRRTLTKGRGVGLASGLGAASADAVYGCIAAFGLAFISSFLVDQQMWLRLVGGIFLCYLGITTLLKKSETRPVDAGKRGLLGAFASTFFLTLTNPITILSFAAIFAGLGLAEGSTDYGSAGALVLGVFIGSSLWWFLLSFGFSLFRSKIDLGGHLWINRISGVVIAGFGILALISVRF